jgi:hypothetical protein
MADQESIHAIIAGSNPLSQEIFSFILRFVYYSDQNPIISMIIDADPHQFYHQLQHNIPKLDKIAQVNVYSIAQVQQQNIWHDNKKVTGVYICLDSDPQAIQLAELLSEQLEVAQAANPPIYLHQFNLHQVNQSPTIEQWDGQIYPFSNQIEWAQLMSLFDQSQDELAVIIHNYYCDSEFAQGKQRVDNLSLQVWSSLAETYRLANRNQALHLLIKLTLIHCATVPMTYSNFFVFNVYEVEKLARLEHHRWCVDRYLDGWSYHAIRNNERKHHPLLVDYHQLSESDKDNDRQPVRLLPVLLARNNVAIKPELVIALVIDTRTINMVNKKTQLKKLFQKIENRFSTYQVVLISRYLSPIEQQFHQLGEKYCRAIHHLALIDPLSTVLNQLKQSQTLRGYLPRKAYLQQIVRARHQLHLNSFSAWQQWAMTQSHIVFYLGDSKSLLKEQPIQRLIDLDQKGQLRWSFDF